MWSYFRRVRFEYVLICADAGGGIVPGYKFRSEQLGEGLAIGTNVIEAADEFEVEKSVYLGCLGLCNMRWSFACVGRPVARRRRFAKCG